MKKSIVYGLVLFTLFCGVFAYHINEQEDFFSRNPDYGYSQIFRDSSYVKALFRKNHYNASQPGKPYMYLRAGDSFLFHFPEKDSTVFLKAAEDSSPSMATIMFYSYHINIGVNGQNLSEKSMEAARLVEDLGRVHPTEISKYQMSELAHSNVLKYARTRYKEISETEFWVFQNAAKYAIPISLLLLFLSIWWARGISSFFGGLVGRTEIWVLTLFVLASSILLWFPTSVIWVDYNNDGKWTSVFRFYSLFKIFLPMLLFFWFRYLIRMKWSFYEFVDREAFKFFFIFFATFGFILVSQLMYEYSKDQLSSAGTMQKLSNIGFFTESVIFAMANFLNNFRAHYFKLRREGRSLVQTKLKEQQSTSELESLQSRVNPHFLYNSLNSIAALADLDAGKAKDMALALSEFYKYSTNRKDEIWTTINEEVEMIEKYLKIEKIRFGDKLNFTFDIDKTLGDYRIPKFLIQPLVENAIKYGYNSEIDGIHVDVQILTNSSNEEIIISVADSGADFPKDMDSGYGIRSIQKKLKLSFPEYSLFFQNRKENAEKMVSMLLVNPTKYENGSNS